MEILSPRGARRERGRGPGKPTTGALTGPGRQGSFAGGEKPGRRSGHRAGGGGQRDGRPQSKEWRGHVGEARRRPAAEVS